MRVLAVVPSLFDTSPGQRFRMEQWEPLLAERGVEVDYHAFETAELHSLLYQPGRVAKKIRLIGDAFARRWASLRRAQSYDVIYLFREAALLGPPVFERLLARTGIPVVFDFDDAIFVPYVSPSNGYLSYLKFPAKTRTICKLAAQVIAGNDYLAEYARQTNERVTIIPTTIDTAKYRLAASSTAEEPPPDYVPVIGWSGSYSTVQHLDTLRAALKRLAKTARFRLRVIGTPQYELEGVEVEALRWRADCEVEDLRQMDIGVMPLPDDKWSRGKCGLKALQYMGLGIPTICSPVGVNTTIITDGENGYLAASEDEWVEKLTALLESATLRRRLGLAGRRTVEQEYSAVAQAPRVYEVLRAAARSRKREGVGSRE